MNTDLKIGDYAIDYIDNTRNDFAIIKILYLSYNTHFFATCLFHSGWTETNEPYHAPIGSCVKLGPVLDKLIKILYGK